MRQQMCLIRRQDAAYPEPDQVFAPAVRYPEYRGTSDLSKRNDVYDMVREGFRALRLDEAHMDSPEWNPLGEIIHEGDTVLVKPNWVVHHNPAGDMDSLITHTALVRAVVDYALPAVGKTGKIIVGDAPIQSCDLALLFRKAHLDALEEYYKSTGQPVVFCDLRNHIVKTGKGGRWEHLENTRPYRGAREVDLGKESMFCDLDPETTKRLRVIGYLPGKMNEAHHAERHVYMISDAVLDADVILNLPKPKTHKRAGITAALKNMIGINADKDYVPHHVTGAKEEGGDEYLHKDSLKKSKIRLQEKIDAANEYRQGAKASALRAIQMFTSLLRRIRGTKDEYWEGGWYGNDTMWRTITDINRAVLYADREGRLQRTPQRKMFVIGDGIIAGEGEGPLATTPFHTAAILMSDRSASFDFAVTRLFGLPVEKIRTVQCVRDAEIEKNTVLVIDDGNGAKEIPLAEMPLSEKRIKVPYGWVDYFSEKE